MSCSSCLSFHLTANSTLAVGTTLLTAHTHKSRLGLQRRIEQTGMSGHALNIPERQVDVLLGRDDVQGLDSRMVPTEYRRLLQGTVLLTTVYRAVPENSARPSHSLRESAHGVNRGKSHSIRRGFTVSTLCLAAFNVKTSCHANIDLSLLGSPQSSRYQSIAPFFRESEQLTFCLTYDELMTITNLVPNTCLSLITVHAQKVL